MASWLSRKEYHVKSVVRPAIQVGSVNNVVQQIIIGYIVDSYK